LLFHQSDEELKRREEEERAHLELRERQMFHQRLRQQRLESEADSKWLQQEEQNIELPFSPVRNKLFLVILGFLFVINDHQSKKKDYQSICKG